MNGLWKPYARQREISWASRVAKCAESPLIQGIALAIGLTLMVIAISKGLM